MLHRPRRSDSKAAGRHPRRHGLHPGQQRLRLGRQHRVHHVLRPDVGTPQGSHAARARQARLLHDGRGGLFRLLRGGCGRGRQGVLQLRSGRLAHRRTQLRHRHECRLTAGGVAAKRPRRESAGVYARILEPAALLLGQHVRAAGRRQAPVGRPVRRGCRRRLERRPARLRTLRPPDTRRSGRPRQRDPGVHCGHRRRRQSQPVRHRHGEQRSERQHQLWRAEAHAEHR